MLIIFIFSMLTVPILTMEHQLPFDIEDMQVLHEIIHDVIAQTKIHDTAVLITDFSSTKNIIIDAVIRLTMNTGIPMNCMASNVSSAWDLWPLCHMSSDTLLFYIYKSKDLSNFIDTEDVCYILLHGQSRPKLLLLAILDDTETDFHKFLQYMWSDRKCILDVSVVEVSKTNGSLAFIVHQYNPFSNKYSSQPYSPSVDWFPNKLLNLHGYPITMGRTVVKNAQGSFSNDFRTIKTFQSVMNFTMTLPVLYGSSIDISPLAKAVMTGRFDIVYTRLPLSQLKRSRVDISEDLTSNRQCVVMPVLYKRNNFDYNRTFRIILCLIIIAIFWLTVTILKFKSNAWEMLNIFGMIISYSLPKFRITAWSERVLFVSVVLVSAAYSSDLYADLTSSNMGAREKIQVDKYQDLLEHGLTPMFPEEIYDVSIRQLPEDFLALRGKVRTVRNMSECWEHLTQHGNVCCLMEFRMAMEIMQMFTLERDITINEKLCFRMASNGFYLYQYSPYTRRFNDIILRLQQAGLTGKWFMDDILIISRGNLTLAKNKGTDYGNADRATMKIFIVATCGYGISMLIFLAEHIVHRLKTYQMFGKIAGVLRQVHSNSARQSTIPVFHRRKTFTVMPVKATVPRNN